MSEKFKKILNNKYFIIVLVVLLIALVIGTGTYAWLTWSSPSTTKLTVKIGNIADVIFDKGKDINTTSLAPVFTSDQGEKTSFSIVKRSSAGSSQIFYDVTLDITSIATELKDSSFKYILMDKNTNTILTSGDFSTATDNSTISLYSGNLNDSRKDFDFIIYIDGNTENNSNMMNKAFKASLNVSASENNSNGTMVELIQKLYTENKNGTMVNNGSGMEYSIAPSVSLMNDGLGGAAASLDGGNIRYYGSSPDNYIKFNCEEYPDTNCEIWRIIGVFTNERQVLKIIKDEPASSTSVPMHLGIQTGINWKKSAIGKLFNSVEAGCSSYFKPDFDGTKTCSITSLINNYSDSYLEEIVNAGFQRTETQVMIYPHPNYLFSYEEIINGNATIEDFYNYTVSNVDTSSSDTIYVGILDAVDYGYASDFVNDCTTGISSFDELGTCGNQTWLYNHFSQTEYFINAENGYALATNDKGTIEFGLPVVEASGVYRPVVYLNENVKYISGDGSEDNPYTIQYNN